MVQNGVVTDLTPQVGQYATCTGINNGGLVCGSKLDPAHNFLEGSGFVIDLNNPGAGVTAIPAPPGQTGSYPASINDAGDVLLLDDLDASYIFRNGEFIAIPSPSWWFSVGAHAPMNAAGRLAGFSDASGKPIVWDTKTTPPTPMTVPLPGGFLGGATCAINDQGVIVGACWMGNTQPDDVALFYSFIHDPAIDTPTSSRLLGDLVTIPGYGRGLPAAINEFGQILVDWGHSAILTPTNLGLQVNPQLPWIVATILFGVTQDGGGLGLVGGGGVRVPPNQPPDGWTALSPAARDALIGLAVNQIAGQIGDAAGREAVGRAALELARASVGRLTTPSPSAPTLGLARPGFRRSRFVRRRPKLDQSSH